MGLCTYHGGLLYDRVVSLLQITVQDVTQHTGRILMQIASSFGHTVVFASEWNVNAFFLFAYILKTDYK